MFIGHFFFIDTIGPCFNYIVIWFVIIIFFFIEEYVYMSYRSYTGRRSYNFVNILDEVITSSRDIDEVITSSCDIDEVKTSTHMQLEIIFNSLLNK